MRQHPDKAMAEGFGKRLDTFHWPEVKTALYINRSGGGENEQMGMEYQVIIRSARRRSRRAVHSKDPGEPASNPAGNLWVP